MTVPLPNAIDRPFAATRLNLRDFGLILVQLAALVVLVWQFHLEEKRHLFEALVMACGGFAVHAWLPVCYRRVWYIMLSIGAIVLVLGFEQAAYVLAVAASLIAVTQLPIAFWWRVALLVMLAAGFVWWRINWSAMFWPIVGSMFMFRLIVHMQSVQRERVPSSLSETCSYFLLFPNAFFPFFPVVDYSTFRETYYNDERRRIYQTGVHWMTVGVAHLVIYRLIKYELLPTPLEIRSGADAAMFLAMNYALYVRVSGLFHLICGMLHLFGFNLPRTHDAYFLASSFSDIWRRINIYWKDFMMKTFFFPAYFRTRFIGGDRLGVALAVLWVFLWTWLGHSWQVFWLLGDFPLRMHDALLWLGVGGLVAVNAVFDYRRAATVPSEATGFSFARATVHSLKVLGVFACVSVFWAHWTNPEVLKMLVYSTYVSPFRSADLLIVGGAACCFVLAGVGVQHLMHRHRAVADLFRDEAHFTFDRSVGRHLVPLVLVLLISQPPVHQILGAQTSRLVAGLQVDKASRGEALAIIEGYYEDLNDVSLQSGPFLGDPAPKRAVEAVDFSDLLQRRNDLLEHELIPKWTGSWNGAPITINRWGMRDRERSIVKPEGTVRIALVGSSLVMGYGVGDDQTFAQLLERRLNAGTDASHPRFEVLNFGCGRYFPLHRRLQIKHKVLPFHPDVVLYFSHQDETYTSAPRLATGVFQRMKLEDPCLVEIVRNAGITNDTSEALMQIVLQGRHLEILSCLYRGMSADCRAAGARLLHCYVPIPGDHALTFDPTICLRTAAEAGIETVDLTHWWGDELPSEVLLGPIDHHPNALGHRLLAAAVEEVLRKRLGLIHQPQSAAGR